MKNSKNSPHGKLAKFNEVYVNSDGTYAEDAFDGNELAIQTDSDGYKFVDNSSCKVYLDDAVAKGFLKVPGACEAYYVKHLDGDPGNCRKDNLKWETVDKKVLTPARTVFFTGGSYITRDGELVIKKGKVVEHAQIRDRWLDDDLDRVWVYEIPVAFTYETEIWGPKMHDIEEWMDKAGYIGGDKTVLKKPSILHIDGNVCNFRSDNLLWVEEGDPRYVQFKADFLQRQKDLIKKYNKGYSLPVDWPQ